MVSCRDALSSDSPRIEGIEGNRPLWVGGIRRNPASIALVKFFPTSSRLHREVIFNQNTFTSELSEYFYMASFSATKTKKMLQYVAT